MLKTWVHKLRSLRLLAIAVYLLCCTSLSAAAQSADQDYLHTLVNKFFDAYQRAQLDELMSLWSAQSPDLAAQRQVMQQTFNATGKITLENLAFKKIAIAGDKADVLVVVETSAADKKREESSAKISRSNRTFHCIKEDSIWKIWAYVPSEDELASALVKANTEDERKSLLAQERELVTPDLLKALVAQGDRLFKLGSYKQSLVIYQLALDIAGQFGDSIGQAVALRSIGNIHYYWGDYSQALDFYLNSLKLAEETRSSAEMGRALNNIGNVLFAQGKSIKALEYYERSLKLAEESNNKAEIARTLNNLGNIYSSQDDYMRALDYYRKAMSLKEELGDKGGVAIGLYNVGQALYKQGNYALALDHYKRSLALTEELGRKAGIASTLRAIGNIYYAQDDYLHALLNYLRSLKLAEEMGDKAGKTATLIDIGLCLQSEGSYAKALEYYREALKLAEDLGDNREIVRAVNSIGVAYQGQGSYQQALEYYQRGLLLLEKLERKGESVHIHRNIGQVNESLGKYAEAVESYQTGLRLAEESGETASAASLLNDLGNIYYSHGDYAKAIEASARAAHLAEQSRDSKIYSDARVIAGKSFHILKQSDQAQQAFAEAIDALQKLRYRAPVAGLEKQFFGDKPTPYHEMLSLMVERNRIAEAFGYAEMAKGDALRDVMQNGAATITKEITEDEQQRERAYYEELISLSSQIHYEELRQPPDTTRTDNLLTRLQAVRLEYEEFEKKLYTAHPRLKVLRGNIRPLALDEAAALLNGGESALLEFAVTPEKTYLFVLTENGKGKSPVALEAYTVQIGREELSSQIEKFREALIKREADFDELARHLYDLLLGPARKQLAGKSVLCIVPDSVLWRLPFQALQSRSKRYVIEDHAISYAPSLSALREMQKPPSHLKDDAASRKENSEKATVTSGFSSATSISHPLLAVRQQPPSLALLASANPTLDKERQEAIGLIYGEELTPTTDDEAKTLSRLPTLMRSWTLTGSDACEKRAKAEIGNYQVVHFATPGVLDDNSPMSSHLLLSNDECGDYEDGLLSVSELLKLNLQAGLTVLSANQTIRGRTGGGEAIIALAWALWVAGCPATVISQWKEDFAATVPFMSEFYRKMNVEEQNPKAVQLKARAIQSAQLKLLKSKPYHHPYYWARFMLIGAG